MLRLVRTREKPPIPEPSPAEDENTLFQRLKAGDMAAFEAFYKLYYPRLFRFIQRISRQPETVEEIIQETLLVVWQKPEGFNYTSKLSTWVFGIAYNKTLKALDHNARNAHADSDDWLAEVADPAANLAQRHENEDWLNCALASLPPDQRAVIELAFYHGLPYQDIAHILNCPENTVKTRMFHARKRLQSFSNN
ncbi:RNA polymerase sigma factor [Methylovulum psychrotolerans]|jgi:RNA polymerase sigma-70 factor (ECF subfamily)|uniref:RNA polymerase sigma factor n=1 Tax=Methylovulum psychrotolerans TaxID=1704499 RepID=A0A2S5CMP4_9GAMM|nr:RNA polymerase sigma factor [Methylovulum psychrotolerans]MBT9099490.1 RNA polymerase sigma factor [Methylovulum psychrotolerans]POZ52054.1 RNA polymerase sigma factor [Methylovulum psychrotolerans]